MKRGWFEGGLAEQHMAVSTAGVRTVATHGVRLFGCGGRGAHSKHSLGDFSGCAVVACSACDAYFCGWCQSDCGNRGGGGNRGVEASEAWGDTQECRHAKAGAETAVCSQIQRCGTMWNNVEQCGADSNAKERNLFDDADAKINPSEAVDMSTHTYTHQRS